MSGPTPGVRSHVTGLLRRWGRGDHEALDRLMPLVYEELHRIASRHVASGRAGRTLQRPAPQAEVVELRFFGGLSVEEAAEVLSISPSSVKRE